jgi:hypothetical protein
MDEDQWAQARLLIADCDSRFADAAARPSGGA